jgi:large subunit ribosomal protein L17
VLAERYKERPGGYTRLMRAGLRKTDKAPIAIVELVDCPNEFKSWQEKQTNKNQIS